MDNDVNFKKASDQETDYGTGAKRDYRRGKGAQKWLPSDAIDLLSHVYEEGNLGRGWRNWEFGMPLEDLLDSALRHLSRYKAGDRSEPHLSQALWNLLNALQTSIWIWMGSRPKSLNNLEDHRGFWYPDMESPCPLSHKEIEWLNSMGLTPDSIHVDDKYLAGIIDGEGTISIVGSETKGFYPTIRVYNNSSKLLQKLMTHFPNGRVNCARESTEKQGASYVLNWNGYAAIEVVKRISPHLLIKKRQADLISALFMVKTTIEEGFLSKDQGISALSELKAEINFLNRKGQKEGGASLDLTSAKDMWIQARSSAEAFLKVALDSKTKALSDLLKEAHAQGISKDALKRAKARLGVVSIGLGRGSQWSLNSPVPAGCMAKVAPPAVEPTSPEEKHTHFIELDDDELDVL